MWFGGPLILGPAGVLVAHAVPMCTAFQAEGVMHVCVPMLLIKVRTWLLDMTYDDMKDVPACAAAEITQQSACTLLHSRIVGDTDHVT